MVNAESLHRLVSHRTPYTIVKHGGGQLLVVLDCDGLRRYRYDEEKGISMSAEELTYFKSLGELTDRDLKPFYDAFIGLRELLA